MHVEYLDRYVCEVHETDRANDQEDEEALTEQSHVRGQYGAEIDQQIGQVCHGRLQTGEVSQPPARSHGFEIVDRAAHAHPAIMAQEDDQVSFLSGLRGAVPSGLASSSYQEGIQKTSY